MKRSLRVFVILIACFCMMAPSLARVHQVSEQEGNSGYQGTVVMDNQGNIAFTVVAAVNGDFSSAQTTSPDAAAGQTATASGQAVFAGSGAGNTNTQYASTGDMAMGGSIATEQGAHATTTEAGAGQHDTTVAGTSAVAGSTAGNLEGNQEATSLAVVDNGVVTVDHQGAGIDSSVGTGQDVSATGENILFTSTASNGQGSAIAITAASSPIGIATASADQHAGAGSSGVGAGQDASANAADILIASDAGAAGKIAGSFTAVTDGHATVTGQGAEVEINGGASSGQQSDAVGATVAMNAFAGFIFGSSATANVEATDAVVGADQVAEWDLGAIAHQDVLATGGSAELTTTAANGGDFAGTDAGMTNGMVMAMQNAQAALGMGAQSDQNALVTATGGTGHAETWADAADGNGAFTFIEFGGDHGAPATSGILNTNQYAEAAGYADAWQGSVPQNENFVTVVGGDASAGSGAYSADGNFALTKAWVDNGGDITTDQGAIAGDGSFDEFGLTFDVDGAAAGQRTEIEIAAPGSSAGAKSISTNGEDNGGFGAAHASLFFGEADGGAGAGTKVVIHGPGAIDTEQGAAAGTIGASYMTLPIEAEGAVAVQDSTFNSVDGGLAKSWASNEDGSHASTIAGYHGVGSVTDTEQGAAAGEIGVPGFGEIGGAVALQHTCEITSDEELSAFASSHAGNGDGFANTWDNTGNGEIVETTQGAAAGQLFADIPGMSIEAGGESIAAGQYTGEITSTNGGSAGSDAGMEDGYYAKTEASFSGAGSIIETGQGAGVGGVGFEAFGIEGGAGGIAAVQVTDHINGATGGSSISYVAPGSGPASASSSASWSGGVGSINGLVQGAVLGGAGVEIDHFEASGEIAAAGQYVEFMTAPNGVMVTTASHESTENTATTSTSYTGTGIIAEGAQIAAAGELGIDHIGGAEGALAGQMIGETFGNGGTSTTTATSEGGANTATSQVTFTGVGTMNELIQGAGAGGAGVDLDDIFGFDLGIGGGGAASGQHVDSVTSTTGASATSSATSDGNEGISTASFTGAGLISDAFQVTAAGGAGGEIEGHHIDAGIGIDAALAAQEVDVITSTGGCTAAASASQDSGDNLASASTTVDGIGTIDGAIQGAAVAGVEAGGSVHHNYGGLFAEGAAAGQHVDIVTSTLGGSSVSEATSGTNSGTAGVGFTGVGTIAEASNGAAAGEVAAFISGHHHHDGLVAEGAAAGSMADLVASTNGGTGYASATSGGTTDQESDSYTGPGSLIDGSWGAAQGSAHFF